MLSLTTSEGSRNFYSRRIARWI